MNKRTVELADAYELDIATGELTLLAENLGMVGGFFPGRNGDLFAFSLTADGDVELSVWVPADRTLRSIRAFNGADYTLGIWPMVVTPTARASCSARIRGWAVTGARGGDACDLRPG